MFQEPIKLKSSNTHKRKLYQSGHYVNTSNVEKNSKQSEYGLCNRGHELSPEWASHSCYSSGKNVTKLKESDELITKNCEEVKSVRVLKSGRGSEKELVTLTAEQTLYCSKNCKLFVKRISKQKIYKDCTSIVIEVISDYDRKLKETFILDPGSERDFYPRSWLQVLKKMSKLQTATSYPTTTEFRTTISSHDIRTKK